MAKLYYGNGECSIEGSDIRGVEIRYRGAIKIDDKTSDAFVINHQKNGIMIFPIGEGVLNELFSYTGEFRILSVIVADTDAKKVPTSIHRVMDYTELLTTNAEDMTTISEDLSATYVSGYKVAKTSLKQPNLNNQHTSNQNGELYLEGGTLYDGDFHIHLADNAAMTGKEHNEDSQDLYYVDGKPTRNPSLIPYATIKYNRKQKLKKRKQKALRNRRRR